MNVDLAVLYLTKKANDSEIESFKAWLNTTPENKEYYEQWVECWEATAKTYELIDTKTNSAWDIISKKTIYNTKGKNISRSLFIIISRVAAVILLLISITFITLKLNKSGLLQGEQYIVYSSVADTLSVRLSDGTRVCLNKYSILYAPKKFNKKVRKVYFNGEAYFDVAHDAIHPFKIIAKSTTTEVLGTSFNLISRTNENTTKLTLVKGKVALYNNNDDKDKIIILPGQIGIFDETSGNFKTETVKDFNMLAWKTGKLQFKSATLKDLCKTLAIFYNVKIVYVERIKSVEKELFTGNFDNVTLEKALDIINLTLNVNITRNKESIRIYYKL